MWGKKGKEMKETNTLPGFPSSAANIVRRTIAFQFFFPHTITTNYPK